MEWFLLTPLSGEGSCPGQSSLYTIPGDLPIPSSSSVSPFRSRMLEEILSTRIMVKGSMKKQAADKVSSSIRSSKFSLFARISTESLCQFLVPYNTNFYEHNFSEGPQPSNSPSKVYYEILHHLHAGIK